MSDKLTLEEKTRAGKAWKQYIKEKSPDGTVRVMITSKDPEKSEKKDSPFSKKSDKKDDKDSGEKKANPFAKKSDKKDDDKGEKKANPFTKKSDKDSGEKKDSPFSKKSEKKGDKGEKKDNPFAKKEWVFMFPTWQEWMEAKEQ